MQAYLYQTLSVAAGSKYRVSFEYESTVEAVSQVFAGFASLANVEAQTDVGDTDSEYNTFSIPNEEGTKTFDITLESDQDVFFLAVNLGDTGNINFDNVSVKRLTGTPLVGILLDNITAALGKVWEVVYYGSYFFTNAAGTVWKEIPTADSDLIRLDVDAINILMYEYMLTLQQELKGKNMAADFAYFRNQLEGTPKRIGLYDAYQKKYPDQTIMRQTTYYNFGDLSGDDFDINNDDE